MNELSLHYERGLLPSYLIAGDRIQSLVFLERFFEERGEALKGNPDVRFVFADSFGIEEARLSKDFSLVSPLSPSGKKILILSARIFSREAQNALLKFIEEPGPQTHIFLLTENPGHLLPTIHSRVFSLNFEEDTKNEARAFLKQNARERMLLCKKIAEQKDKDRALSLVRGLIKEIQGDLKEGKEKQLSALLLAESFLQDRAPSLKIILETVSLIV